MRTVEVKSNIAGDILKIRKGVIYKEYATVIDELLQNCQRAKAKQINVTFQENRLIIEDNGVGCKDPQDLFEKNISAWCNEDEAFGEGFFSIFLIADSVNIRSYDWSLSLDILNLIETKNMEIQVTDGLELIEGFKVELQGKLIKDHNYNLQEEVKNIGAILPIQVTLNEILVEPKPLLSKQNENEQFVKSEIFEAMLYPSADYSGVSYFYENRPIRRDYMHGISGRVEIKKGCITLKAPDRKEFIYDEKRKILSKAMEEAAKEVYHNFIKTATDEQIEAMQTAIEIYVTVEEYAAILSVSERLFYNSLNCSADTPDPNIGNILNHIEYHEEKERVPYTSHFELPKETPEKRLRPEGRLKALILKEKKLVYVPQSKIEEYTDQVKEAEYNGFIVVYATNQLYEKAFKFYGVKNIENLKKEFITKNIIENTEPKSKKEERLLFLMNRITEHYKMKEGSIRLADLSQETRYAETGELLNNNNTEVHGLCSGKHGVIYLNRKIANFPAYKAPIVEHAKVTPQDYKVLLRINQTLCHELAHLIYGLDDNTIELSNAMSQIGYEIPELF